MNMITRLRIDDHKDNCHSISGKLMVATIIFLITISASYSSFAQSELMAWGNLSGIRVDGQLMEFETSIRIVSKDWTNIVATGKERQRPKFHREGQIQTVTTNFSGFQFSEIVEDLGKGSTKITIHARAEADTLIEGVFLCIDLPEKYFANGTVAYKNGSTVNLSDLKMARANKSKATSSTSVAIDGEGRKLELTFDSKLPIFIRKEPGVSGIQLYVRIIGAKIKEGQHAEKSFTITADGLIDKSPVKIEIDAKNPGRLFEGLGGNFRLQNPKADSQVIQYCLDNLRVSWGRVEMPWQLWHPDEDKDPIAEAEAGNLNDHVHQSMLMAQKLAKLGMPVIVSDWQAPEWAILGDPRDAFRFRSQGIYGYPLKPEKAEKIYCSIGDYLIFLKQNYGVEAAMFSFNESDLGINVRHTGKEHADFIKGLGAHLASRGLATSLLLGDNSDATTFDFILPAMEDPETHKYIGAVSFHSWRGCDDKTLEKWAGAARKLNVPLIIGEGSTDAAAWSYPEIFYEQSFALHEINLYTRLCAICQPLSILQWQLTSDYSILRGGGIYGTEGPIAPTQRFWNLKQLAATPEHAFALPISSSHEAINCAAFGNLARGEYAVHLVNNGAERKATVTGLPDEITKVEVYVTNKEKGMEKTAVLDVKNGTTEVTLLPATFTTLIGKYNTIE
jgi:hypothetical protein